MNDDPGFRSLRGRLGAFVLHSTHDSRELTANGRKAFLDRFETQVDPDGVLPVEERRRRADAALRAHMTRLAMKRRKGRKERYGPPGRRRAVSSVSLERDA